MTSRVDTSVLISIVKAEPSAGAWVNVLEDVCTGGDIVICDVVAAEYFAVLLDEKKFYASLSALGITFSPMSIESAQMAGRIFKQYRREGGPREHLVPDFLIGAHAQLQAERIAAIDRGYLRRYFPKLQIVKAS